MNDDEWSDTYDTPMDTADTKPLLILFAIEIMGLSIYNDHITDKSCWSISLRA